MKTKQDVVIAILLGIAVMFGLHQITKTERYYVVYNTYVQNDRGEMVEQDEFKHLSLDSKSLADATERILEIENQLYEDIIVDSVAVQDYVIVKEY